MNTTIHNMKTEQLLSEKENHTGGESVAVGQRHGG